MRTIKRYSNRKLYDTEEKRYITLDGIAELIRAGYDIQVVENDTGEDLTAVTLSQIIFEQQKRGNPAPQGFFTNLIRFGNGSPLDLFRRSLLLSANAFSMVEKEIERRLLELVEQGSMAEEQMRRLQADLMARFHDGESLRPRDREDSLLTRLNLPTRGEVLELAERLDSLTTRLDELILATRARANEGQGAGEPDMPPPEAEPRPVP